MSSLGQHLLIDFFECDVEIINSEIKVREFMLAAAKLANATIVTETIHRFNPHGISGMVVIAESHLAIHTWPEHGCAAVDVFTCGDTMKTELICGYLQDAFKAKRHKLTAVERGVGAY